MVLINYGSGLQILSFDKKYINKKERERRLPGYSQ